jgi:hypothetical protein
MSRLGILLIRIFFATLSLVALVVAGVLWLNQR